MFNLTVLFFFQSLLCVTLIFWGLSLLGEYFFTPPAAPKGDDIFECGFFTTHHLKLSFNFSFFLLGLLLILYDVEFFFLIPGLFNLWQLTAWTISLLGLFFSLIVVSFVYDWQQTFATEWGE